jgi:hypothetical protein
MKPPHPRRGQLLKPGRFRPVPASVPEEGVLMRGVLNRLGDRLLDRFVPKTVAKACEAGTMATWTEYCGCPGGIGLYRVCDNCGGVSCSPCTLVGRCR